MVLSRSASQVALTYVLKDVFHLPESSPVHLALQAEGIRHIEDLLVLTPEQINDLRYTDKGESLRLSLGHRNIIRLFIDFVRHRINVGEPIGDDYNSLNSEVFDDYRTSAHLMPTVSMAPTAVATARTDSAASKLSLVEVFRRGIKLDASTFKPLKDERFNDQWHLSFDTQARAMGFDNLLDPNYDASTKTSPEQEEFKERQKWLYAVLESKVETDHGRRIVKEHAEDFDAQAVIKKLKEHHLRSTKALINSSTILSYITSARLGNGEWGGTYENFVMHWQEQVRLYEKQVPETDRFSEGQKRTLLENAVHKVEELRRVKITADIDKVKHGRELSYSEYCSLLLAAAATYDKSIEPTKSIKSKRSVYIHDLRDYEYDDLVDDVDDDHDVFTMDTPVEMLQVYATARANRQRSQMSSSQRVRMPLERWSKLAPSARLLWDKLSDSEKAIILGYPPLDRQSQAKPPPNSMLQSNLHDISAYDFLQSHVHDFAKDSGGAEQSDNTDKTDNHNEDQTPALLINAAKSKSPLTPGDIRRVLSTSSKKDKSVQFETNTHMLYCVSNHTRDSPSSLVDRGANGGIAGNDLRVITRSSRRVDVQGIDNHQLCGMPICTAGGVITTNIGPMIAIFHQYALHGTGPSIHSSGQWESYGNNVDDRSFRVGGKQQVLTHDGYTIPLTIK